MRRRVWVVATTLLLTRLYGLGASTSQQVERPRPTLGGVRRVAVQPTAENAHFKGTITKVLPGPVLMVNAEQTSSVHFLELTPATSLKAKQKADFGGRRNLDFEDLAVGQRIKVTYEIATNETLKIKVLDQATLPH